MAEEKKHEREITIGILLVLAIAAVYLPVIWLDFLNYDDPDYVLENIHVCSGIKWEGILWAFTHSHSGNWHPLTWISHMLDCQFYGLKPAGHHVTNLLFHTANTLLLFGLLRFLTGAVWRSACVAALFAVHPLHVESVAWIAERKDVLSAFFWILTMWAYVKYLEDPVFRRYALVLISFALGLMAKPMLVTLPFALLLADYWPLRRFSFDSDRHAIWRLALEKIPLIALTVVASIITFEVQKAGGSVNGLEKIPLGLRIENAAVTYLAYIRNFLWPVRLAAFYPYPISVPLSWAVGRVLAMLGFNIAALMLARRYAYLLVGWFWYLGTLVPVIGVVQVGGQARADRYTYIPLIGILIIVAWGCSELLADSHYRQVVLAT